ncbi:glycosyltransferase family A protein [Massilia sp. PWRC2]|uniref:glycosyltransferase family A protein n=1 Tax=Massilia sp. PWRC2 TaxID=2804626 RepID=UPI003CEE19D0
MTGQVNISAIVPAYNVERYIEAALASLLGQSAPFHEILIVDDGSTDGTAAMLGQYLAHPLVRIVRTANGGQGRARNLALRMATGNYVYFFDADDLLRRDFVAAMQALLAGRPAIDIVYFSGQSFVDQGLDPHYQADLLPDYRRGIDREFASGVAATGALLQAGSCFASPCLYLSRRRLWGQGGLLFLPIVHEDEEIITRLSCAAGLSVCLDTVYFERRLRPGSTMTQARSQRHADGYLHTLASLAQQFRQQRRLLAPIAPQLVRRFYALLAGYLALCKASGTRPHYRAVGAHLLTLRRLPGARQIVEMSASAAFKARLSRLARRLRRITSRSKGPA